MKRFVLFVVIMSFFLPIAIKCRVTTNRPDIPQASTNKRSLYIIIHGTWGHESKWYLPGGNFFETLKKQIASPQAIIIPFTWSGRNSHESRIIAGHQLKTLIQSYPIPIDIYLINHSHGGTVASLATQFMAEDPRNNHHIKAMLNLGTPIDPSRYAPNYSIVDYVLNFFSFNDFVQPVWGHCKREYPAHTQVANIRTTINDREPDHNQLHSPIIATWLPTILSQLTPPANQTINPYVTAIAMNFTIDKQPTISRDTWRIIDIKLDEGIQKYRGTGINSSWQTFFKVILYYSPGNKQPLDYPVKSKNWKPRIKKFLRTMINSWKKIIASALSPLYD